MTSKRRNFTPEFKAHVAVEAIKGKLSTSELARKYDLHPNLIRKWKNRFVEGLPEIFSDKSKQEDRARQKLEAKLQKQVDQLQLELDWLKKQVDIID